MRCLMIWRGVQGGVQEDVYQKGRGRGDNLHGDGPQKARIFHPMILDYCDDDEHDDDEKLHNGRSLKISFLMKLHM